MVNFPGRNSRRRRVLHEEVRLAASPRAGLRAVADEEETGPAPRYSDAAGVENHPQITDFVPRRHRTIVLLLMMGLASTGTLAALHYVGPLFALWPGSATPPTLDEAAFDLAAPGSVASWAGSNVLLFASAVCLLVYSIRRHRIDDFRGRYRIWLAAAAACLLLSANSVAGLHQVLASALGHVTGWAALRAGAVWWLTLAGLPLAWVALRTLLDVKECRFAASLLVAAVGCYVTAVASYLGIASSYLEPLIETMLVGVATFCGHWLLLAAVVCYARFVILDAQGLIPRKEAQEPAESTAARGSPRSTPHSEPQVLPIQTPGGRRDDGWVDGSQPERKVYEDSEDDLPGDSRKLSKADRKRLRKLKAQQRAA